MTPSPLPQTSRVKPLFDYLKKRSENEKFIKTLEIASTFSLIAFFLFFAVKPTVITISGLLGDIESKKILKKELRTKINNIIQAQDAFSQVQESYGIVNASLPDRPEYYQAAHQIQKQGQELNLDVDNLVFDLNEPENNKDWPADLRSYSVSLGVRGNFISSSTFISELSKNRRIMNIDPIGFYSLTDEELKASSSATVNNDINTRFTIQFYYWPPLGN